jgi:hypothetical protein
MQLPKVERMADIVSHAAAVKLAMDGAFDEKIAALKAAQAEHDEAVAIAATLADAKKIKDDAIEQAGKASAAAALTTASAQELMDKAKAREATVSARESAVASRESTVDARQAAQDTREQAILDAQNARDKDLSARETAVKKAETDLVGKVKKLAADQTAFNQRLDSLRV